MAELDRSPRLPDPDAVFVRLVRAHRDLSAEESRRLDAALVLLLANQLGDAALLDRAIEAARAAVLASPEAP
ncbi:MAG: DUF2783 domain-containing protein [Geminicoccaceae bacterium]|nr:DUF2783 domain-containing protein [Geminicoccaceae bacterium]MCX8101277.1 DUF2783 domain-containing protein [Geminicoccaceae bacterium]MDW8370747.1 DUF2783 domain-containing protein [Geminicoccaceae bacterium]